MGASNWRPILLAGTTCAILSCGGGGGNGAQLEQCITPAEDPPTIDLPDGGELLLWQRATAEITGTDTDVFTVNLDCDPGYGFNLTVTAVGGGNMDVEIVDEIWDRPYTTNQFGPGTGEGLILMAHGLELPAVWTISVRSANGEPGQYEIGVRPEQL